MASGVQHTGRACRAVEVWWSDTGWADVSFTFWVCVCVLRVFSSMPLFIFFVLCVCCVCVVRLVCVCVCPRVAFFFVASTLSLAPWSPGISYFFGSPVCRFLHHILFLLQACSFDEDGAVALFRCPSALVPAWLRTVLHFSRETMTTVFFSFTVSTEPPSCRSSVLHWKRRAERAKEE